MLCVPFCLFFNKGFGIAFVVFWLQGIKISASDFGPTQICSVSFCMLPFGYKALVLLYPADSVLRDTYNEDAAGYASCFQSTADGV